MRIFFDTEFIENGKTIKLISIGLVTENGGQLYLESSEYTIEDQLKASPWIQEHVNPQLLGLTFSRKEIARQIKEFVGSCPEFWAYYASYDWVALCQLYGTMMDLPQTWPMYVKDIKQLGDSIKIAPLLGVRKGQHNALGDALWNKQAFEYLVMKGARP